MGITDTVYFTYCKPYFEKATAILELGAQLFLVGGKSVGYFKNVLRFPITSLDYTGENESLPLNLSTELPIQQQYDLVTNFGTSEHVSNQYICWKNIHSFCSEGGYVLCEIPEKGSWKHHCKYYVTHSFFEAMSHEFEIIFFKQIFYRGQGNNCFCILRKRNPTWQLSESEFLKQIFIDSSYVDKQSY